MADDDWSPPSAEEMKLIEARRARSDQISKLMASYLLKGYKMLGTECTKCGTILLQDRSETKYCVACEELDCDTQKDDPAFLPPGAPNEGHKESTKVAVAHQASPLPANSSLSSPRVKVAPISPRGAPHLDEGADYLSMSSIDVHCWPANPSQLGGAGGGGGDQATGKVAPPSEHPVLQGSAPGSLPLQSQPSTSLGDMSYSITVLEKKIRWASQALNESKSIDTSTELCKLIKAAADAVVALRKAAH